MIYALAVIAAGAMVLLHMQTRAHARQVSELCQRLQAPQEAQYALLPPVQTSPQYLPFEDDEAFLKYAEEHSGSAD